MLFNSVPGWYHAVVQNNAGLDVKDIDVKGNRVAANRLGLHLNAPGQKLISFEDWLNPVADVVI
jgi:hypothetical protein